MNSKSCFTVMIFLILPLFIKAQEVPESVQLQLPDSLTKKVQDSLLISDTAFHVLDSLQHTADSLNESFGNTLNPLADTTGASADTIKVDLPKKKEPKPPYLHQFRIGFDIGKVVYDFLNNANTAYEIQADYRLRKDVYIAAEGGWGRGIVDYTNLKYTTSSTYLRIGVEKSMLDRISKRDLDIAFFGFRYGIGIGERSDATFIVPSQFGPPKEGVSPAQSFVLHWGEMVAGIKTELWNGIYAGWNFRAKFLLNSGTFKELAPNFVAGYGKADRSTSFDFNFYLSYAIRWGRDDYDSLKKQ